MSKAFLRFYRVNPIFFFLNYHLHFRRTNNYILKSQFHINISGIYQEIFIKIRAN